MEGQNASKCLCARLPAKKHYSLDTATIVENWRNAFLHIKNTFRKPSEAFFWLLRKITSFWSEALCFENKRAEPRHVTMICHCGILLFINAKATINTRKLTYNCCWVCRDKLQLVETFSFDIFTLAIKNDRPRREHELQITHASAKANVSFF